MRPGVSVFNRALLFSTRTRIWCSLSHRWRNDEKKSHGSKMSHRWRKSVSLFRRLSSTRRWLTTQDVGSRYPVGYTLGLRQISTAVSDSRCTSRHQAIQYLRAAVRFRRFATSGSRAVPPRPRHVHAREKSVCFLTQLRVANRRGCGMTRSQYCRLE